MEETSGSKSDDGWSDVAIGYYLNPEYVWDGPSGVKRRSKLATANIRKEWRNHTWNQFGTGEISGPNFGSCDKWFQDIRWADTYVSFLVEDEESLRYNNHENGWPVIFGFQLSYRYHAQELQRDVVIAREYLSNASWNDGPVTTWTRISFSLSTICRRVMEFSDHSA